MFGNLLVLLVVAAILGLAAGKIRTDKKKGIQCTGCPYSRECAAGAACSSAGPSGPGR